MDRYQKELERIVMEQEKEREKLNEEYQKELQSIRASYKASSILFQLAPFPGLNSPKMCLCFPFINIYEPGIVYFKVSNLHGLLNSIDLKEINNELEKIITEKLKKYEENP